jgi:hypothetical protein
VSNKIVQDYGVAPYKDAQEEFRNNPSESEKSYIDEMKTPTWFHMMALQLQKHSELIKPYMGQDYPESEHYYPDPLYTPEWPGDQPQGSFEGMYSCPGCMFTASVEYPFERREDGSFDCANGQICFPFSSVFCMTPEDTDLYGVNPDALSSPTGHAHAYAAASWWWTVTGSEAVSLSVVPKADKLRSSAWKCIAPLAGWPIGTFYVTIHAEDMYGNRCKTNLRYECEEIPCCNQESYVAPTIDAESTPDTIAPGGSIEVDILDGCPPFTWSVSGEGYSFEHAETEGRTNTLSLEDEDCGDGAGAYAILTITDDCGNVATGGTEVSPRNTEGEWVAYDPATGCIFPGPVTSEYKVTPAAFAIYRETVDDDGIPVLHHVSRLGCCHVSVGTCSSYCTVLGDYHEPCLESDYPMCDPSDPFCSAGSWKLNCPIGTMYVYKWAC